MAATPIDAKARLRAHVDAILASSSVPSAERADVAEEMYGHLWMRWQETVAAGVSAPEAAETAISSFGRAGQLGRQMTGAYHSRLYASTIGLLLPAVAPSEKPPGVGRLQLLLVLTTLVAVWESGVLYLTPVRYLVEEMRIWDAWQIPLSLTPGRALAFEIGIGLQVCLAVLAYRALGRAQLWALRYAQLLMALILVLGASKLFSPPGDNVTTDGIIPIWDISIPWLALLGVYALPAAIGPRMAAWVAGSRPLGRRLLALLVAATALSQVLPPVAPAVPDPTQVSANDLDLRLWAACTRDPAGNAIIIDVAAQFRWGRTDLFPTGLGTLRTSTSPTDGLVLFVRPGEGHRLDEYRALWLEPAARLHGYANGKWWLEPVALTPSDGYWSAIGPPMLAIDGGPADEAKIDLYQVPAIVSTGNYLDLLTSTAIDVRSLQARSLYVIRDRYHWHYGADAILDADPLIVVRYGHMGRFTVQAAATCSRSGSGEALPPPPGSDRVQL